MSVSAYNRPNLISTISCVAIASRRALCSASSRVFRATIRASGTTCASWSGKGSAARATITEMAQLDSVVRFRSSSGPYCAKKPEGTSSFIK